MPDLRGLTAPEAGRMGQQAGVRVVGPAGDGLSLHQLQGTVLAQHPEAGAMVPRHSEVTVWTTGPGGDAGVREPRRPLPQTLDNHAALDPGDD